MTPDEVKKRLNEFRKTSKGYQDVQRLMIRYGFECFFRRLAASNHQNEFVLKGAMLLATLAKEGHRNTKDTDFQIYGRHNAKSLQSMFLEICSMEQDDGLTFDLNSVQVSDAGEEREYPGFLVTVKASLGGSPITLSFDVGFGEVITPATRIIEIPVLAGMPRPKLRAYPWETVIAEKLEAMVKLGMRNGRLKDFYDLAEISSLQEFEGVVLAEAIKNTFGHRGTEIPKSVPLALTGEFYESKKKVTDWKAFLTRHALPNATKLDECCKEIADFILPVLEHLASDEPFTCTWKNSEWQR